MHEGWRLVRDGKGFERVALSFHMCTHVPWHMLTDAVANLRAHIHTRTHITHAAHRHRQCTTA